jgi:hypothetical protein
MGLFYLAGTLLSLWYFLRVIEWSAYWLENCESTAAKFFWSVIGIWAVPLGAIALPMAIAMVVF